MINPIDLEKAFHEFSSDLSKWAPDGVVKIDLPLLHDMGILKTDHMEETEEDEEEDVTHYFHVFESEEKVTLVNDQFAIWIVPQMAEEQATTMTYVSLWQNSKPNLEVVFSASGVYNTPRYILKVLQYFLKDTIDTEALITSLEKKET